MDPPHFEICIKEEPVDWMPPEPYVNEEMPPMPVEHIKLEPLDEPIVSDTECSVYVECNPDIDPDSDDPMSCVQTKMEPLDDCESLLTPLFVEGIDTGVVESVQHHQKHQSALKRKQKKNCKLYILCIIWIKIHLTFPLQLTGSFTSSASTANNFIQH